MPPPSPQSSIGARDRRHAHGVAAAAAASTAWMDTVFGDEGAARARGGLDLLVGAPISPRTRSSTAGASDRRKLHSRQPKLSGKVRTSECSV